MLDKYKLIIDGGLFSIVWLACAWWSTRMPMLAVLIAGTVVWGMHYAWGANVKRMQFAILVMFAGLGFEMLMGRLGWLAYAIGPGYIDLPPFWLALLWLNFGFVWPHVFSMLKLTWQRLVLIGVVLGPLSYFVSVQFGAIDVLDLWAYPALLLFWGFAFVLMVPSYVWYRPSKRVFRR